MRDADEEVRVRADALAILLPRLLLHPTGSAWWSSTSLKAVRTRCHRFLAYEWRDLYVESEPYAPAPFDPQAAAEREAVLRDRRLLHERADSRTARQLQLDHVIQKVRDGLVSKATQTLLSTGTAPSTQATALGAPLQWYSSAERIPRFNATFKGLLSSWLGEIVAQAAPNGLTVASTMAFDIEVDRGVDVPTMGRTIPDQLVQV
jgi:hypothetical protein